MPDSAMLPDPRKLLYDLEHDEALRHQPVAIKELPSDLALLRTWQSARLGRTYADLLKDKHYAPACQFFLSDIYAARDFSQRDHDIERLHDFLARILPAIMIELLTQTVELNRLTNQLDEALVRALVDEFGVIKAITGELYAQAYRKCGNYTDRARQIQLTAAVLLQVGEGARFPVVGIAMKMIKTPAQRAGWVELYDFLARGYAAFRQMKDIKKFVSIIEARETELLERVFAGEINPYN